VLRSVPEPGGERREDRGAACVLGVCDGSGWILQEDNTARPCDCQARRIGKAVSTRLGTRIPKRFQGVSFDRKPISDLDTSVLREVRRYVEQVDARLDAGDGYWFFGDTGTGKTSLAMLISRKALEAGRSVAIYSVPVLLTRIRATYGEGSSFSYLELFEHLCSVDLLQLDDIGAENVTPWVAEQLYSIVNERWQDKRSVIVTSNLHDRDALSEQVGGRTLSRLDEMCEAIPVMGPDLRLAPGG